MLSGRGAVPAKPRPRVYYRVAAWPLCPVVFLVPLCPPAPQSNPKLAFAIVASMPQSAALSVPWQWPVHRPGMS